MNTKLIKAILWAGVLAAGAMAGLPASANGGHHHGGPRVTFGFAFGGPLYYGPRYYAPYYSPYYYPPYAYPPYVAGAVPPAPTVYVERDSSAQQAPALQAGYWYYCAESQAYYPYVKQCAGGWQQVAPQPAS